MDAPLPNWELAIIPDRKLRDYVLDPEHPFGRAKARFFADVLGYSNANWLDMRRAILAALPHHAARRGETDGFGTRYEVLMRLSGPTGRSARVMSIPSKAASSCSS